MYLTRNQAYAQAYRGFESLPLRHHAVANSRFALHDASMTEFNIIDLICRPLVAVVIGTLIGLNRDLHRKVAGVRTHSLVTLSSALIVMGMIDLGSVSSADAVSRVLQGIMTGVGFLGAGVIIRNARGHVTGLTTAATIWVSAVMGALCGLGAWGLIAVATILIFLILLLGGRFERLMESKVGKSVSEPQDTSGPL